jgi:hypothetical protein
MPARDGLCVRCLVRLVLTTAVISAAVARLRRTRH